MLPLYFYLTKGEYNVKNESTVKVDDRLKHIAFIMDGNGRWANKRGLVREQGHKKGVETFVEVTKYCKALGIRYVTVYAFSTENWKRPQKEVEAIMGLLDSYLEKKLPEGVSFRFVGDMSKLSPALVKKIRAVEERTRDGEYVLNVALNYGSRAEIVHACNSLIAQGKTEITEEDLNRALYTGDCPDPDLIIRTGGDLRISNFLLWQAAYSELYFTDVLWPDLKSSDIDEAIENFYSRKRRFGGLDKEKNN